MLMGRRPEPHPEISFFLRRYASGKVPLPRTPFLSVNKTKNTCLNNLLGQVLIISLCGTTRLRRPCQSTHSLRTSMRSLRITGRAPGAPTDTSVRSVCPPEAIRHRSRHRNPTACGSLVTTNPMGTLLGQRFVFLSILWCSRFVNKIFLLLQIFQFLLTLFPDKQLLLHGAVGVFQRGRQFRQTRIIRAHRRVG